MKRKLLSLQIKNIKETDFYSLRVTTYVTRRQQSDARTSMFREHANNFFFYLFFKQITKSPIRSPNNYKENQYESTNMPRKKSSRPFNFKGNRVVTLSMSKENFKKSLNHIYFCFVFKNNQVIQLCKKL
jgi:hypothetical protein